MNSSEESAEKTRRAFCVQACQVASLLTLGALVPGCGGGPMSPSVVPLLSVVAGTVVNGALVIPVALGSPLSAVGGAARVQASAGDFLVARTAQNTFVALTAICTHAGCVVTGFSNQAFVCPCHGSEFNTNGGVRLGPASSSLRQFPTQFADDVLTVTI